MIQKFKRVNLRPNLVPTLECLIDVIPRHPALNIFLIFFHPKHSFYTPSLTPRWLIIGESFQLEFETIYLWWLFWDLAKGMTRLKCFFVSSCKEANTVFRFVSLYKEANLWPNICRCFYGMCCLILLKNLMCFADQLQLKIVQVLWILFW